MQALTNVKIMFKNVHFSDSFFKISPHDCIQGFSQIFPEHQLAILNDTKTSEDLKNLTVSRIGYLSETI